MTLKILSVQVVGIAACFIWTFTAAFILFKIVDKVMGVRVSIEEELEGLDATEHGGTAYPDFTTINHGGLGSLGGPGGSSPESATAGFTAKKLAGEV